MDIQSTDYTKQQLGQGSEQFAVLSRGYLPVSKYGFVSGNDITVESEVFKTYSTSGSQYMTSFDVYLEVGNPEHSGGFPYDNYKIRLNYNDDTMYGNVIMSGRWWTGSPGYLGTNLFIQFHAPVTTYYPTKNPFAVDNIFGFSYIIYSQNT